MRVDFFVENHMGHRTQLENWRTHWPDREAPIRWWPVEVPKQRRGFGPLFPVRLGIAARKTAHDASLDGLTVAHTQWVALGLRRARRLVVSTDATSAAFARADVRPQHRRSRLRRAGGALLNREALRVLHHAQLVIAQSSWTADIMMTVEGVDPGQIQVISPGVALPSPREGASGCCTSGLRLLFVGYDFERKGGEILLDWARRSLHLRPNARLDIVSPSAPSDVAGGPVHVHRSLSPGSDELVGLLAAADVFVLPTLQDIGPMSILEAMAHGVPVVAPRLGAIPEFLEDGRSGFLHAAGDAQSFAQTMDNVLDDHARRKEIGAAARRRIEKSHDIRTQTTSLSQVLAGLV